MSEGAEELLTRGIAAAKANQKDEARRYLEWMLGFDVRSDRRQQILAWLWLSELADDPQEKRRCLEQILSRDPSNRMARRGLAILDGRLKPEDIIDPDQQPASPSQAGTVQRMVCPKCGGNMAYAPDGRALRCEYCAQQERKQALSASQGAVLQEHDFLVAAATARGHIHPVKMHTFTCEGCGADFILAPDVLSLNCSYCGAAHVADVSEVSELIPPEGVIPFAVTREEAQGAFRRWLTKKNMRQAKITPARGVYLPAWTFDMSGEAPWTCYGSDDGESAFAQGTHLVYEDDLLILATQKSTVGLVEKELNKFLLGDVIPYEHSYLADWPAEAYQISVADASELARDKMREKVKKTLHTRCGAQMDYVKEVRLNTFGVVIESFKLILLPFWIACYRHKDNVYHLIVNGQTGKVRAQRPRNRLQKFFDGLFD
jgi:hypothetical protein